MASPSLPEERLARHSELQSLLLDLAQQMLMSALDKAALARMVFGKISGSLNADVCFNYLIDEEASSLRLVAGFGIPGEFWEGSQRLEMGQAFCGTVAETCAPFHADLDLILQDEKGLFVRGMGVQAYSAHPLFARDGRVIGTFSMASTRRTSFDPEEVDFLQTLCYLLALAWERGDREREIQDLNADLERRIRARTAELQQSNDALMRSNIELQHFAHAVAHDLQTPLRSIAGFAQLLQLEARGRFERHIDDWLAQVVGNTRRLQILIQELLTYSRLGAAPGFRETDLRTIFDEVVATLTIPIAEAHAHVSCNDLPTLAVDRTQISLLFQNLIENGIKYNTSKPPRVWISCRRSGDNWVFSVADNGMGIDPRHHERIFEMFRRLHTYDKIPGTGIGLAICRRIVEHHGGRLWVESLAGAGSVFHFNLPARSPAQALPGQAQ